MVLCIGIVFAYIYENPYRFKQPFRVIFDHLSEIKRNNYNN